MINFILLLLALAGFGVSYYIFKSKRKNKKMVCTFGGDCNNVLYSKYNNVFGVPLEIGGMIYYFAVFLLTGLFMAGVLDLFGISVSSILIVIGAIAVVFSAYLTFIQGVVLKDWCQWCLSSGAISLLIFIVEIIP